MLDRYCVTCHNERVKTADLMLDRVDVADPGAEREVWEKVMRKVRIGHHAPAEHAAALATTTAARC